MTNYFNFISNILLQIFSILVMHVTQKAGIPFGGIPAFTIYYLNFFSLTAEIINIMGRRISSFMPGKSIMFLGGIGSTTCAI